MGSHSLVYDTFCSSQRTRGVTLCCPCKCLSSTQQGWPITDSPVLSLLILSPMFFSPPSSSLPLPYSTQPPFPFLSQVQLSAPPILSQVLSSFITCTFPHLKQLKTSPRTHLWLRFHYLRLSARSAAHRKTWCQTCPHRTGETGSGPGSRALRSQSPGTSDSW